MKIGIIQLCSSLDFAVNLKKIKIFLRDAKSLGVEAIFLPECFYSLSDGSAPTPYLVEKGNEHYQNIQALAQEFSIFLIGGSAATKTKNGVVNRAYNFDPLGNDLGYYDKINLFACDLEGNKKITESDIYAPGNEGKIIEAQDLKIGESICFDVRFPQMYRNYVEQGANLLTIPAAFTIPTGKAHWETLVRARAIENQCFVVAAAQWGDNNHKIQTYGHSLIVDPWGRVLGDATEGEKLLVATLDLNLVKQVRKQVLVFK